MRRRIVTVALAVLLAVAGVVAVLAYVQKANDRAIQGLKAVSTLVAKQAIPAGTSAEAAWRAGLLQAERLPASAVPDNAVTSITPDISQLVTSAAVQPGQLLLRPMLVSRAQVTGTIAIPDKQLAVAVEICLAADVAGYVQPGSYVAVFDTYSDSSTTNLQETCDASRQGQNPSAVHTRMVLNNVKVLSVAAAPVGSQGTASSSGVLNSSPTVNSVASQGAVLVTLAVTQKQAEQLILAQQAGLPYLGLLTPSSDTRLDYAPTSLFKS